MCLRCQKVYALQRAKSHFPLLVLYVDEKQPRIAMCPCTLRSGVEFKVIKAYGEHDDANRISGIHY